MADKKHTVVFVEWSTKGRDFEIVFPLMYYFEIKLKWNCEYISIFNLPALLKSKPDIVIMSNTTGAPENHRMARLLERSNIPLFSHVSEGMFREKDIEDFVWGWAKGKKHFSETLSMVWSQKSYNTAIRHYPQTMLTYRMSGAVGFDKYQIYNHRLIQQHNYAKTVGYAAFDFNNIMDKRDQLIAKYGAKQISKVMELAKLSNSILKYLISNNMDILFLLKTHPGDGSRMALEYEGLIQCSNVRLIDSGTSIVDVIASSDIWLNINSSTNIEAWLLGKPSISFNTDSENYSSDIILGSLIENQPEVIQKYINEYYESGSIRDFEKKNSLRKKLISDYIGFDDGMNHIRFMSFIKPYIDLIESTHLSRKISWAVPLSCRIKGYLYHIVFLISKNRGNLPYFKKWSSKYGQFSVNDIARAKREKYPDLDCFYNLMEAKIDTLYKGYAKSWEAKNSI